MCCFERGRLSLSNPPLDALDREVGYLHSESQNNLYKSSILLIGWETERFIHTLVGKYAGATKNSRTTTLRMSQPIMGFIRMALRLRTSWDRVHVPLDQHFKEKAGQYLSHKIRNIDVKRLLVSQGMSLNVRSRTFEAHHHSG